MSDIRTDCTGCKYIDREIDEKPCFKCLRAWHRILFKRQTNTTEGGTKDEKVQN